MVDVGQGVQVEEARPDHGVARLNDPIDWLGVGVPHEDDAVVLVHDLAVPVHDVIAALVPDHETAGQLRPHAGTSVGVPS